MQDTHMVIKSQSFLDYRVPQQEVYKETYTLVSEDLPIVLEIIKEEHPTIRPTDYVNLAKAIESDFGCKCLAKDLEAYYSPSFEGMADDYNYFQKIAEYEY